MNLYQRKLVKWVLVICWMIVFCLAAYVITSQIISFLLGLVLFATACIAIAFPVKYTEQQVEEMRIRKILAYRKSEEKYEKKRAKKEKRREIINRIWKNIVEVFELIGMGILYLAGVAFIIICIIAFII
jgi:hypothetical protein